jgi:hypothetical protein
MWWPDLARRLVAAPVLILVTAACQSTGPVGTPTGSAASTPPGTVGPVTTGEPSVLEGEFEIGDGDFFLDDPRVGLAALASYTESLTVAFDGTIDGQPGAWSMSYRMQHTAQPTVSVLTITASGDAETPDPGVLAEADGTAYQLAADGTCSGLAMDPEQSILALSEPAGQLPGLMGAVDAGPATENGIATTRYTFDARAMLESGGPVTAGEIWMAADAGYVLKYHRTTTADATYFGDGLDGTMTWDYGLSDVNGLASIELPGGCQLDAPIMPGASNVFVDGRYAGFDTQSSIADVIAYYKGQLPGRGWAVKAEPFKSDVTAVVEFGKGGQVITLIVTTRENGRRVDLALTSGG